MFFYLLTRCLCSLLYFFKYIVWIWCGKPLKTLLVILRSMHEFGLICMFVIASFRCTLDSYFLLALLSVVFMSRKFSKCLWFSNSTVYVFARSCLFYISKDLPACDLSGKRASLSYTKRLNGLGQLFCSSRLLLFTDILFFANSILIALPKVKVQ